jgi:transposase
MVTLTARSRISRREVSELAGELFGIRLSSGTVDAICQRASAALREPHERLVASLLEAETLNVDETGWFRAGEQCTLWTAASPTQRSSGSPPTATASGWTSCSATTTGSSAPTECWWAYEHLDPDRRQACWEHLKRDFRRHAEGVGAQKRFGEAGLALSGRVFEAWHAFQQHRDRRRLARALKPIQRELRTLLEQGGRKSSYTRFHRVFANKLLKILPALWTFASVEGVEPTNNAAERALGGPVIQRKLSHGNQSGASPSVPSPPRSPAASRPLTLRLHGRTPHRSRPRRSPPSAGVSTGLNDYPFGCLTSRLAVRQVPG